MRRSLMSPTLRSAAALLLAAAPALAQIDVRPAGFLRVEGDSTLHRWGTTLTDVRMAFRLADGAPPSLPEAIAGARVSALAVALPVAELKSGESGLDKNLRKALMAERFPDILYTLGRYALVPAGPDGILTAKTTGELTIAGRTRPAAIDVKVRPGPDGVELTGAYALKMSDFGITPPTLMLGAIRVKDLVAIRFDLTVRTPPQEEKPQ